MKVIHFITDDKFLNSVIELFEEIKELDNRYINIIFDKNEPFQFVTSDKVERINVSEIPEMITNPNICDVIAIHNLNSLPCEFIKDIHKKIKVVWFSWGFDIYANRYPQFELIKLKNKIKPKTISFRYRVRMLNESYRIFLSQLKNRKENERLDFISAIHRIDFYSGVYPIEYELLKKNRFFQAKQVYFNYPSKKGLFIIERINDNIKPQGDSILIGNSGTKLGNHLNSFWKLRKLSLNNRKIIVPLSYAGDSLYRSIVNKKGQKFFKENFIPLTTFIPIDKYIHLMSSVSISIYNVEQQAAVGNIMLSLWNGAKVFFPETSLNYHFFKSNGFKIFSIEKDLNQTEIDTLLSDDEILENRKKIIDIFSFESAKQKVRECFLFIENN